MKKKILTIFFYWNGTNVIFYDKLSLKKSFCIKSFFLRLRGSAKMNFIHKSVEEVKLKKIIRFKCKYCYLVYFLFAHCL